MSLLATIVSVFVFILITMGIMAIGLMQSKPLTGSCGNVFADGVCSVCGKTSDQACAK